MACNMLVLGEELGKGLGEFPMGQGLGEGLGQELVPGLVPGFACNVKESRVSLVGNAGATKSFFHEIVVIIFPLKRIELVWVLLSS